MNLFILPWIKEFPRSWPCICIDMWLFGAFELYFSQYHGLKLSFSIFPEKTWYSTISILFLIFLSFLSFSSVVAPIPSTKYRLQQLNEPPNTETWHVCYICYAMQISNRGIDNSSVVASLNVTYTSKRDMNAYHKIIKPAFSRHNSVCVCCRCDISICIYQ